jgi:hypothetical protein
MFRANRFGAVRDHRRESSCLVLAQRKVRTTVPLRDLQLIAKKRFSPPFLAPKERVSGGSPRLQLIAPRVDMRRQTSFRSQGVSCHSARYVTEILETCFGTRSEGRFLGVLAEKSVPKRCPIGHACSQFAIDCTFAHRELAVNH